MTLILRVLFVFMNLFGTAYAADEPLQVGVMRFIPPFVMQRANNQVYGYDIDMMNSLCKIMQRTCQYHVMRFDELIPSVINKKMDVAVSSITITAERAKLVNFSMPYLPSYSRFLMKKQKVMPAFNLSLFSNKTIGLITGTIFADQIKDMGIKNPNIKEYSKIETLLEGLNSGALNFILLDSPTALYWEANSGGAFVTAGPSYLFGFGLGIVASPNVLAALNSAILTYQSSPEFKLNFDRNLDQF